MPDGSVPSLEEIRELFPITREWAYFNHANVAPVGRHVVEASRAALDSQAFGGAHTEHDREVRREQVRAAAAALIGASLDEVAFVTNTSHGLSLVAAGIPWDAGDNMVTTAVEYPSNILPWQNLGRFGVEVRLVPGRDGLVYPEDLFAAVDQHSRVLALSFVEFASGQRNDFATIGRFSRERGIRFVVDAIQGLGALQLDVEECTVDYLAAGAHKWLLGPQGVGVLYIRRERLEELWVSQIGADGMVQSHSRGAGARFLPSAARFEGGAENYVGIYGLGASLDLLNRVGREQVEARVLSLARRLSDGLGARGYRVTGAREPAQLSGIVSFRSPRHGDQEVQRVLEKARVYTVVRPLGVRASPHFYNSVEEIDRLVEALP